MDEGQPPQECRAGEKEDSANLNPDDRQDDSHTDNEISETIRARVALRMLLSQLNAKQQDADLHEEMINDTSQLKQENEALKSEMSSVLSEGERKTDILVKLINVQWAQQEQMEEDLAEKSMMIEKLLATIQELRTINLDLAVQLGSAQCSEKGWWRRQREKVLKGMTTFRQLFKRSVGMRTSKRSVFNRSNKVHPVNFDVE